MGPVIYLIGGAPRVGKSALANLLLARHSLSILATDALVHMLMNVAPQLGVTDKGRLQEKAAKLFPYLKGFIRYNSLSIEHFCLEGELILPEHARRLMEEYPIRSCFLGMSHTAPEIPARDAGPNDRVNHPSRDRSERLPREVMEQSAFIQAECDKFDMPYFDVTGDYPANLEGAYQCLLTDRPS